MTEHEAVTIARTLAADRNWTWLEPAITISRRQWLFFGSHRWTVISNGGRRGCNVRVQIDDSGQVISAGYVSR
jgi:hypothetical protein